MSLIKNVAFSSLTTVLKKFMIGDISLCAQPWDLNST